MHFLLASAGTDGDVVPYVGLGAKLRSRGHRVTLVANEQYGPLAAEQGLSFRSLVSDDETRELVGNPDLWHPVKSALVGSRWGVRFFARQYDLLAELARDENTVIVAATAILPARLVQETMGRRLASVVLQPWMIPSVDTPPIMSAGLNLPSWAPRPAVRAYWRFLEAIGDVLVGRELNRIRKRIGLRPIRRVFRWWFSPELVIGMFPEWYAPPQPDWPRPMRLAGFPMYDGGSAKEAGLPAELLEFCRAGKPPVAFTFGTGMLHGARLFRDAVEACRALARPAVLVTRHAHQLPGPLPPFVRHVEFAPFRRLFPHCAAVVHHGGIGTTAKALAAGTPQLILPMAFDQMDNATRVKRLGAGDWLKPKRRGAARMAQALMPLVSPVAKRRCRETAERFGEDDALETTAGWVEELAHPARRASR